MSSQPSQSDEMYRQLNSLISQLQSYHQKTQDQQQNIQLLDSISMNKQRQKYEMEIHDLKLDLSVCQKHSWKLQEKVKELQNQVAFRCKKEYRRLADSLVEKQNEIQALNKELSRKKAKILSLETDIVAATSAKDHLSNSVFKSIQFIKFTLNQLRNVVDQSELDLITFDSKAKQTLDRIEMIINLQSQFQSKRNHTETRYHKLKQESDYLIQKNINYQIQIQKLKQKCNQITKNQINRKHQSNEKHKAQDIPHKQADEYFISSLKQVIQQQKNNNLKLKQLQTKITQLIQQQNNEQKLLSHIQQLQQQRKSILDELNNIKSQINPLFKQSLLEKDHPRIYQFFKNKMNQIQNFYTRINQIQLNIKNTIHMVQNITIHGLPKVNQAQINAENSKKLKEKLAQVKNQTEKKLNSQYQISKKALQQLYEGKMKYYEERINNLLSDKEKLQRIVLIQKCQIPIQTSFHPSPPSSHTQSKCSTKQSKLLLYLQQQNTTLSSQNNLLISKLSQYKQQLKKIFTIENTKNSKIKRCLECYLRITEDDDTVRICQNCKKEFHVQDCIKEHTHNCRTAKNRLRSKTVKPKNNRKADNLKNSRFIDKPEIDYF